MIRTVSDNQTIGYVETEMSTMSSIITSLNKKEKINLIKDKYNLKHGNGKRKRKKKK